MVYSVWLSVRHSLSRVVPRDLQGLSSCKEKMMFTGNKIWTRVVYCKA